MPDYPPPTISVRSFSIRLRTHNVSRCQATTKVPSPDNVLRLACSGKPSKLHDHPKRNLYCLSSSFLDGSAQLTKVPHYLKRALLRSGRNAANSVIKQQGLPRLKYVVDTCVKCLFWVLKWPLPRSGPHTSINLPRIKRAEKSSKSSSSRLTAPSRSHNLTSLKLHGSTYAQPSGSLPVASRSCDSTAHCRCPR
jgi:hypothetical protein